MAKNSSRKSTKKNTARKSAKAAGSARTGRFVKSPAKSGSVKTALVDRAIKKVAKTRISTSAKTSSPRSARVKA